MIDVTVSVGRGEEFQTSLLKHREDSSRWCSVWARTDEGSSITLRFEGHDTSLRLLDELRYQLEEASKYLRGGKA